MRLIRQIPYLQYPSSIGTSPAAVEQGSRDPFGPGPGYATEAAYEGPTLWLMGDECGLN